MNTRIPPKCNNVRNRTGCVLLGVQTLSLKETWQLEIALEDSVTRKAGLYCDDGHVERRQSARPVSLL